MAAYTTTSRSSVTQYGITVTFSAARPCWQYPNGDWGVQRPVTIQSYTPAPANDGAYDYNGAMINPVSGSGNYANATKQGMINGASLLPASGLEYDPALNIGLLLPYTLPADASVLFATPGEWDPEKTYFREFSVLTCLAVIPEAGSFRPPYAGSNKAIPASWNVGSLDYGRLRRDPIPTAAGWPGIAGPTSGLAYYTTATVRPVLDICPSAIPPNTQFKAATDSPRIGAFPRRAYGAHEIAPVANNVGLILNADYSDAQKEPLLINMVQWAIDLYGLSMNGAIFAGNGGHNCGRKIVLAIGAVALDDANMRARLNGSLGLWNEDTTHFFVQQSDIDTQKNLVSYTGYEGHANYQNPLRLVNYTTEHIGMAEWCFGTWDHANKTPQMFQASPGSGEVWTGYNFGYRAGNAGADIPACYLYQIMGLRTTINNEAFFRYTFDRSVGGYLPGFSAAMQELWARDMQAVSSVTLNIPNGIYEPEKLVTAATSTSGAAIRFTNNGAIPNSGSTLYVSSVPVAPTLKFIAFSAGLPDSPITTATYTIVSNGTPAPPTNLRFTP